MASRLAPCSSPPDCSQFILEQGRIPRRESRFARSLSLCVVREADFVPNTKIARRFIRSGLARSLLFHFAKQAAGRRPARWSARMNRRLIDYNPEGQGAEGEALLLGMPPRPSRAASSEVGELEFASAFLDAASPAALRALVNRSMQYVSRKTGHPLRPDVARALAPRLVRAGAIISGLLPTRKIITPGGGSELATAAAERIFGTEFEGLSAEDQEFETARYFVRFALEAARPAALAPIGRPPAAVAALAERIAARRHAPGLIGTVTPTYPGFRSRRAVRRTFV